MNYHVYQMYLEQKRLIARAEACPNEHDEEEKSLLADMKLSITILEEADPEYLRRSKMEQEMYESFTPEQRDFICAQIGWWYLLWKENMATGEGTQHRLGFAKEQLKTMICGDQDDN